MRDPHDQPGPRRAGRAESQRRRFDCADWLCRVEPAAPVWPTADFTNREWIEPVPCPKIGAWRTNPTDFFPRIQGAHPTSFHVGRLIALEIGPNLYRAGAQIGRRNQPTQTTRNAAVKKSQHASGVKSLDRENDQQHRDDGQRRAAGGHIENVRQHAESDRQQSDHPRPLSALDGLYRQKK